MAVCSERFCEGVRPTELLYAEARLGEILERHPSHVGRKGGGSEKILPQGMTQKQSHYAQELSRNEDAIAETLHRELFYFFVVILSVMM